MSIYYDFSKINSYKCPIKIVVSRRGLGKTFGILKRFVERFVTDKEQFVYVVETQEMVRELAKNNGDKFWKALVEFYKEQDTSRKRYFFERLVGVTVDDTEETDVPDELKSKSDLRVIGSTIRIGQDTAGYIVDLNSFGELKRNNFNGVKRIFVDEFITEKLDKTALANPKKVSSIVQSIGRLRDIEIFMSGNAVRLDDPILSRIGFKINRYGYYFKHDKYGLLCVLHFVNPDDYPDFAEAHDKSVAGRMARLFGETNEEDNKFSSDLPDNRRLTSFKYRKNGWSINLIRDDVTVTIKEREDGTFACVPFVSSKLTKCLFCLSEKEQGFKNGYHIICNKALKPAILSMLRANTVYYYSEIEYSKLKIIIKGD